MFTFKKQKSEFFSALFVETLVVNFVCLSHCLKITGVYFLQPFAATMNENIV